MLTRPSAAHQPVTTFSSVSYSVTFLRDKPQFQQFPQREYDQARGPLATLLKQPANLFHGTESIIPGSVEGNHHHSKINSHTQVSQDSRLCVTFTAPQPITPVHQRRSCEFLVYLQDFTLLSMWIHSADFTIQAASRTHIPSGTSFQNLFRTKIRSLRYFRAMKSARV